MTGDPERLLDAGGTSSALQRGLAAARGDALDRDRLAQIAARLPLDAPIGTGGQGSSGPADVGATGGAAAAPSTALSGLGLGAAIGAVIVGAVWLLPMRSAPPPDRGRPAVMASAGPVAEAPAPPLRAEPPQPDPPLATPPQPAPAPVANAPAPVANAPAPVANAPASQAGSTASAKAGGASAQSALPDTETETGLLQRAQDALASRPAEALSLAEAHRARFPGGALAQEREVIAISALSALGHRDQARARADSFVSSHPSSAYRRRLEVLLPELTSSVPDRESSSPR